MNPNTASGDAPDDRERRAGASPGAGFAASVDTRPDWRNLTDAQFERELAELLAGNGR